MKRTFSTIALKPSFISVKSGNRSSPVCIVRSSLIIRRFRTHVREEVKPGRAARCSFSTQKGVWQGSTHLDNVVQIPVDLRAQPIFRNRSPRFPKSPSTNRRISSVRMRKRSRYISAQKGESLTSLVSQESSSTPMYFDVSHLIPGSYILQVQSESRVVVLQLIKMGTEVGYWKRSKDPFISQGFFMGKSYLLPPIPGPRW